MTTLTLTQVLDEGEKFIRHIYFDDPKTRTLGPTFHLQCKPKNILILAANFGDDVPKDVFARAVGKLAREHHATHVMFMSETWSSQYADAEDLSLADPPSQRPDRREGVEILVTDGKDHAARLFLITRDAHDYVTEMTLDGRIDATIEPTEINFLKGVL